MKVVSSVCLSKNSDRLYLGTDNGDLYTFDTLSFKLINGVLRHETIIQEYVYHIETSLRFILSFLACCDVPLPVKQEAQLPLRQRAMQM